MKTIFKLLLAGRLYHKIAERYCSPITKKTGLNTTELRILSLIAESKHAINAREISECQGLSKALVSKSVDHLKKRGYLLLLPDPNDMRRVELCLTDDAKPVMKAYSKIKTELKHDIEGDIDSDTLDILDQSLDDVIFTMKSLFILKDQKDH